MCDRSRNFASKSKSDKRATDGRQSGDRRATRGRQKELILSLESDLRRSLRDGVFSLTDFEYPLCLFRHLRSVVH